MQIEQGPVNQRKCRIGKWWEMLDATEFGRSLPNKDFGLKH